MENTFITITPLDNLELTDYVKPGERMILKKTPDEYDEEAITVYSSNNKKYGSVANSSNTVVRGTHSAGYIYRGFYQEIRCVVRFVLDKVTIAEVLLEEADMEEGRKRMRAMGICCE